MLCFQCGVCCESYQPRIPVAEAERLTAALGISWAEFVADYTDRRWPGTESYLLRQKDGHCVFLRREKDRRVGLCSIHKFRPADCRNWMPGLSKRECLKGLREHWGLKVDDTWCLKGPEARLKEFERHLAAIMGIVDNQTSPKGRSSGKGHSIHAHACSQPRPRQKPPHHAGGNRRC